jgi:predicted transcriptional regulator
VSFEALAWAFRQDVKNPDKAVLIALAYRDNHDAPHGCFPSLETVAHDCGVTRRTVINCLKSLIAAKLIKREVRSNDSGLHYTSYYSFPEVWVGNVVHRVVNDVHHVVNNSYPGVVNDVHPERSKSFITGKECKNLSRERATRWPEDFKLTEELRSYAVEHGIAITEVPHEWERFENNHRSKGSKFIDWNRSWYTWVLRHGDFKPMYGGNGNGNAGTSAHESRTRRTLETMQRVLKRTDIGVGEVRFTLPPGN